MTDDRVETPRAVTEAGSIPAEYRVDVARLRITPEVEQAAEPGTHLHVGQHKIYLADPGWSRVKLRHSLAQHAEFRPDIVGFVKGHHLHPVAYRIAAFGNIGGTINVPVAPVVGTRCWECTGTPRHHLSPGVVTALLGPVDQPICFKTVDEGRLCGAVLKLVPRCTEPPEVGG